MYCSSGMQDFLGCCVNTSETAHYGCSEEAFHASIKWILTYTCSHSLKLDIYACLCFTLEFAEDSYCTCFWAVVKLEKQREDQTDWFYLQSGYQKLANWLLGDFFSWYFAIKFQTGSVVRQVGVFLLHCLTGKCFWRHENITIVCWTWVFAYWSSVWGKVLPSTGLEEGSGSVKHPNLIIFYFSPLPSSFVRAS